jgi:hydrogenase-4 component B
MSAWLVLFAIVLAAASGFPGSMLPRRSRAGERIALALMLLASAAGLAGAFVAASCDGDRPQGLALPWRVPGGEIALRLDAIAAMFLAQIFLVAPLVSLYGIGYWPQTAHPENGRKLRLFHGLLTASMGLLVVAKNAMLFLLGWEGMALAAFLVVTTDDRDDEARAAGFVYLVATRVGTLLLFAMFAVLHTASGTWSFSPPGAATPLLRDTIFLLALVGCGLKAGMMPLHVWLPGAHANAPSHVSAYMSGVLIKMGIYGLVRVTSFFEDAPLWWGALVLALGILSGVLGVAFAIGQHDLKRLLAYHSVENIGIILMGLGIAMMGRSAGRPDLVALGLAGALLHVWNHGLFKALLFLSAGSVIHACRTRAIDALGGVAGKMPRSAAAFLVGAVAICGLPPFNGFVSELLVYLGLFRAVLADAPRVWMAGVFGACALALVGALALACFAKVFGAVFLGAPRTEHVRHARESGGTLTVPMLVLAACCGLIGIAPLALVPLLEHATQVWAPEASAVGALAPFAWLSVLGAALAVLVLVGAMLLPRLGPRTSSATWGCGYAAPTARMQYTASSFADSIVRYFRFALRPHVHRVELRQPFPPPARFESHVADVVLDRGVLPAFRRMARGISWFRWIQQGNVHLYVLYIVVTLIVTILARR